MSFCPSANSTVSSCFDGVQARVGAIRRYQAEMQKEIEAMTGAVLERVFRGEL